MKYLILQLFLFPIWVMAQSDFDKAENEFKLGQIPQAKLLFETILKQNPNHLKTLEYLGDIQGSLKNWDKSIYYYEKIKDLKPNVANYYYKYGGALGMKAKESNKFKALGMIGEVKSSFEKAIQLDPKHIEARWALIELYLQLPAIIGGSEVKAKRYSNELAIISPIDGYLSKGYISEYFERFPEAILQYKRAIEIGKSKVCYEKLANLYRNKMNQPEKAKQILEEYEKLK